MASRFLRFVGTSKAAWAITLIPIINLIYPILLGIFAPVEKLIKYMFGGAIITAAIFWLGGHVLPEQFLIIVPCVVMLVLSCLSFILVRPMVLEWKVLHKYAKLRAITIGGTLVLLIGLCFVLFTSSDVKKCTQNALEAIVAQNEEGFDETTYSSELTLKQINQQLEDTGIALQGKVVCKFRNHAEVELLGSAKVYRESYIFVIGTNEYRVDVSYRKEKNKQGLIALSIQSGDGSRIDN